MSYIIPCSASKQQPEIVNNRYESFEDFLNDPQMPFPELNPTRMLLYNEIVGQQPLNFNSTLPAYQLYSGPHACLYNRVSNQNWTKALTDVKIVSALFGLITHTTHIPIYNLKMDSILADGRTVWRVWYDENALQGQINPTDVDLLNNLYRKAIHGNINPVAIEPPVQWRDRYGYHRGRWLNEQLGLL
ncbi:MAG TPA: peroxide stress protein YaaA [Flavipsychrobacter sp.]|nr:peroxide stress protein YaaA [Flavipsychrobacter sp.]